MERYYLGALPGMEPTVQPLERDFDFADYKTYAGRSITTRQGSNRPLTTKRPRTAISTRQGAGNAVVRQDFANTPRTVKPMMVAAQELTTISAMPMQNKRLKPVLTPSGPVLVDDRAIAEIATRPKPEVDITPTAANTANSTKQPGQPMHMQANTTLTSSHDNATGNNTKKGGNMLLWGIGIATGLFLATEATGITSVTGLAGKKKQGALNGTPAKKTSTKTKPKPANRSAKRANTATKKTRQSKSKPVSVTL